LRISHQEHTNTEPRRADVYFALFIGVAAAGSRINREETAKGHATTELPDIFRRRFDLWWNGATEQKVDGAKEVLKEVEGRGKR